jgi:hypothetical protein
MALDRTTDPGGRGVFRADKPFYIGQNLLHDPVRAGGGDARNTGSKVGGFVYQARPCGVVSPYDSGSC